jgi:hypothetical protein
MLWIVLMMAAVPNCSANKMETSKRTVQSTGLVSEIRWHKEATDSELDHRDCRQGNSAKAIVPA